MKIAALVKPTSDRLQTPSRQQHCQRAEYMQIPTSRLLLAGAIAALVPIICGAEDAGSGPVVCHEKVENPKQCHWMTGKIRLTNGTPSIRILRNGKKRSLGVFPPEEEWMPGDLKSKLTFENYAVAEMLVCPIKEKTAPGAMQDVCIDKAKILRVVDR